ncbi:hypothetical protein [Vibrio phage XZ1]|uniref:Protein rIIA n=1 Tax=Vibrio phage ValKK3 TaxID=1610855 RepID=A0A0D4DAE8_9CAUD|nr:RIIA lysis inhibitor [Vibrio phage ValKK3]AJT60959.1 protein rIIA [Vibrio phage ValKK3]UOL51386.1 hypothetical protein [Vibrio phage XZ1]
MIIHTPESKVQTSGKMRTAGFNMKASAKGFRIISTTLYKDPILAIVRELTCNGWDAHQMNKNIDKSIEVHLPNQFEPWFSVKDFGCGMSDDEIFGVYTTVFDSTKDDSNDVIGAMGLGSKTPFSYNNGQSFTVKSTKNGLKAVYSAYLDKGEPAITCMSEPAPTDEPDGVEVIVPVRKEDFDRFKDAAQNVMPYFKSPSVETNMTLPERNFTHMDGYFTESKRNTWRSGDVYAVMGNVCYPLSEGHIQEIHLIRNYFKDSDLFIEFPIGELDVSASREELHYDDYTIDNINKRVKQINSKFLAEAQKWVDDQNFDYIGDAYRACDRRFNDVVLKKLKFNDELVVTYASRMLKDFPIMGKTVRMRPEHSNKEGVQRNTRAARPYDLVNPRNDYSKNPITIIVDDLKSGGVAITKEYIRQESVSIYYHHDDKPSTTAPLAFFKERLRDCEYRVLKTSDLKANYTPQKKSVKKKPAPTTIRLYEMRINDKGERTVKASDVKREVLKSGSFHYVSLFRDYIEKVPECGHGLDYHRSLGMIETIMRIKGIDVVYIARRPEYVHIKGNEKAVNIFDIKFNKRELRSKIDWKSYTVDNNLYGYRSVLPMTWNNDAVRNYFGYARSYHTCNQTIDRLCDHFSAIREIRTQEQEKHLEKLKKIQNESKYELLFKLVGSNTCEESTTKLIKLLRGKRNG